MECKHVLPSHIYISWIQTEFKCYTSLYLIFTRNEFMSKCIHMFRCHENTLSKITEKICKSWPVAGSAVCPPPPTTMTALVLSRGVDSRAQTPTSRCSRRDVSCSALRPTSMCTELNFVEHTHRTAVKRRQSADSRGPTLRDLALGAHHHRLLFNLKTYRKTARDFAHSVLGGTLVTAGLRITQSFKNTRS